MKNKYSFLLYISLCCVSLCFGGIFGISIDPQKRDLIRQLEAKDSLISHLLSSDSTYFQSTKNYAEMIDKFTNDSIFSVNGYKISNQDMINMYYALLDDYVNLVDSLDDYRAILKMAEEYDIRYSIKDTAVNGKHARNLTITKDNRKINQLTEELYIAKQILAFIKSKYGISPRVEVQKDTYNIVFPFSAADSALILLPYYRDCIKRDTNDPKIWNISRIEIPQNQ